MSPIRMERVESGVRAVIAFTEAFNCRDIAGMMQLVSDDCVYEATSPAPDGTVYSGKPAIPEYWQAFFQDHPQAHLRIEDVFGFGLRCIMRWRLEWVEPDGNTRHVRGVDLIESKNGLLSQVQSYLKG